MFRGVITASWLGAMFQYHGTAISTPLDDDEPISGNNKPLRRLSLVGNSM